MALQESEVLDHVRRLLERAADDPDFEERLVADPWGTAEAEGLSRTATVTALDLARDSSDEQVAEALKERVSRSSWAADLGDIPDVVP